MEQYALLGYPLKHTMSPPIHKRLFELEGKSADYEVCEIPPERLADQVAYLNAMDGYNVTIPFKTDIIKYLDWLDDSAKRYNSVNCVVNRMDKNIGFNTDCYGFLRSLEAENISLEGKVLQIGCGGVGRMIATEAAIHGADLTIVALPEFVKGAEDAAKEALTHNPKAQIKVITHDEISGEFDLLINASPVGMFPKVDECPVTEEVVKSCKNVFEVIYNPDVTMLMKIAEKNGIKAVGGMAMLVWQAVVAHEIWSGAKFRDEDIGELISDMKKLMKNQG
ncbi:MAG: shikimate dehydrogenase [Ruminococcus sp.]|nr:shikimate dehydrogenase [Ruminococcus sp.]MCM1380393.1 shikimate dehydrogenase [Muribaculaceae bacterium]MCM1478071.1 shikimate dehydrogenase [Muribaculaceae bacterium]